MNRQQPEPDDAQLHFGFRLPGLSGTLVSQDLQGACNAQYLCPKEH